MLRAFIIFIFCLTSSLTDCLSQETAYFSASFARRENYKTSFKRLYEVENAIIRVKTLVRDSLRSEGFFSGVESSVDIDHYIHFLENNIKLSDSLKVDGKSGELTYYNSAGLLEKRLRFFGDSIAYLQVWDKSGSGILIDGNGELIDSTSTEIKVQSYKKYQKEDQFTIRLDHSDTIYSKVDVMASPTGGISNFRNQLGKILKYPDMAKFFGKQANIYVAFIVDKEGKPIEFEIRNKEKVGYNFEKITLRKLANLTRWTPAYKNGKPVKTAFGFSIAYRLK